MKKKKRVPVPDVMVGGGEAQTTLQTPKAKKLAALAIACGLKLAMVPDKELGLVVFKTPAENARVLTKLVAQVFPKTEADPADDLQAK